MELYFFLLVVGALVLYIAYLHLQLHISRRIINAFQETTLAEKEGRLNLKPALAMLGVLIVVAGFALNWMR
jgi:hypothetical protein